MSESEAYMVTLENSLYWLRALEFQGERLLRSFELDGYPYRSITMMEEQFFLNATHKARRWVIQLRPLLSTPTLVEPFIGTTGEAEYVRHKREHDEEYRGPQGKQEDLRPVARLGSPIIIHAESGLTLHGAGRHLLGGRFDVQSAIDASHDLAGHLQGLQHALWDGRARGRPGTTDHLKIPSKLISN